MARCSERLREHKVKFVVFFSFVLIKSRLLVLERDNGCVCLSCGVEVQDRAVRKQRSYVLDVCRDPNRCCVDFVFPLFCISKAASNWVARLAGGLDG